MSKRQAKFLERGLRELGCETYGEYIESDDWYAKRDEYRESNRPQPCAVCWDPQVDLHHRTYARLGRPWLDDLVPLCRDHHNELHERGLDFYKGPTILYEEYWGRKRKKSGRKRSWAVTLPLRA